MTATTFGTALLLTAAVLRQAPVRTTDPPTPARYSAIGSGHLLRTIGDEGRFLTLEDASRWEVRPDDRFQSVEWQPDAVMTVTATQGDDGFDYLLLNTSADESVAAKFIPVH